MKTSQIASDGVRPENPVACARTSQLSVSVRSETVVAGMGSYSTVRVRWRDSRETGLPEDFWRLQACSRTIGLLLAMSHRDLLH